MDGYLLDTNHVRYWYDEMPSVVDRLKLLPPESPLRISAITLGEIGYGHAVEAPAGLTDVQREFSEFVDSKLPSVLDVTPETVPFYSSVRARLFERFSDRGKRKGLRPEQLVDPATALSLGIQENDVWIAAQALQFNLVLVTNDSMRRIAEVVAELRVENWAAPAPE